MGKETGPICVCEQCGWKWYSRLENPRYCAKCKSKHWDNPNRKVRRRNTSPKRRVFGDVLDVEPNDRESDQDRGQTMGSEGSERFD